MSIIVSKRKAGASTPYVGLWIVTINGRDHASPEPAKSANARIAHVQSSIKAMRADGQSELTILGKYSALSHQR